MRLAAAAAPASAAALAAAAAARLRRALNYERAWLLLLLLLLWFVDPGVGRVVVTLGFFLGHKSPCLAKALQVGLELNPISVFRHAP